MYKIKWSHPYEKNADFKPLKFTVGDYTFYTGDFDEKFDYWLITEGLSNIEKQNIAKENTIFVTGEPPEIKGYSEDFLNQFGTVLTFRDDLNANNIVKCHQLMGWFVKKTRDELLQIHNFEKKKLLSVICSNLDITEGHRKRLAFVKKLKEHFGEEIDFYGRGFNQIYDKWEAIADYKYHVVIENSRHNGYFTEKLMDCYLAGAYAFYHGAPDILEYFPDKSLSIIDINDFEGSLQTIKSAIEGNSYENYLEHINTARDLVLNKYNMYSKVTEICAELALKNTNSPLVLYPAEFLTVHDIKNLGITLNTEEIELYNSLIYGNIPRNINSLKLFESMILKIIIANNHTKYIDYHKLYAFSSSKWFEAVKINLIYGLQTWNIYKNSELKNYIYVKKNSRKLFFRAVKQEIKNVFTQSL